MRLEPVVSMGQSVGKHGDFEGYVLLDAVPGLARNSAVRIGSADAQLALDFTVE